MPQAQANGITIEYDERGSGDPLLMVMGLSGQLIDWPEAMLDMLAESFRVIVFDNRDAGLSTEFDWEPPSQLASMRAMITKRSPKGVEYTVNDMADDAAGLLDALDMASAHVVGASMGGMIGQAMAINHPTRVRSLTSVMSNTGDKRNGTISKRVMAKLARMQPPTQDTAAELGTQMYKLFAGSSWDPVEHEAGMRAAVARSWRPAGTARQAAAIGASPDRTAALAHVTAPTLVVHGMQDKLVKPSGGFATARAVPGSRLLMFPDMGHDMPATRHRETTDAIAANAARAVTV